MTTNLEMNEIHWLMDMFNTVDVGLIVLDRNYKVCIWNSFMENHSGLLPSAVKDKDLFDLFPSVDEKWFRSKSESVFVLKNRSFTIWEQQPYIFRFKNYRPITGKADYMYQNATFIPLTNTMGEVGHMCIILYDVTDIAVNKKELEDLNKKLKQVSEADGLTQLMNRIHWENSFKQEYLRIQRNGSLSALLIFDVDHFKNINDEHGHSCGDAVLRHLANLLRATIRETDIAGRYSGEEFVVALLDTDKEGAIEFTERLRALIESTQVRYEDLEIKITVSIGLACFRNEFKDHEHWIEAANKALQHSKKSGRNKVTAYVDIGDDA